MDKLYDRARNNDVDALIDYLSISEYELPYYRDILYMRLCILFDDNPTEQNRLVLAYGTFIYSSVLIAIGDYISGSKYYRDAVQIMKALESLKISGNSYEYLSQLHNSSVSNSYKDYAYSNVLHLKE